MSDFEEFLKNNTELLRGKTHVQIVQLAKHNQLTIPDQPGKIIFDILYPEKIKQCSKAKFVSLSVGYRNCGKTECPCYVKQLSESVMTSISKRTDEEKKAARQKTTETVNKKYGVSNVSKAFDVKSKIETTKQDRYGDKNFSNREKARLTCLEKYGVSNPTQTQEIVDKIKQTNIERYGVENPLQSSVVRDQIKQTNIERYGVENPLQSSVVRDQIKQTNIERYGVDNAAKNDDVKCKIINSRRPAFFHQVIGRVSDTVIPLFSQDEYNGTLVKHNWKCVTCGNTFPSSLINGNTPECKVCFPNSISKFEREVSEFIMSTGETIIPHDRSVLEGREIDILVVGKFIGIECNGVYWHSELSGKDKTYHLSKTEAAEGKNIKLIHITDMQWETKQAIVKSIITSMLGNTIKIAGRTCSVSQISPSAASEFLTTNHLQGSANGSVCLGLIHQDSIVAVMTFCKSRFSKHHEFELLRYAPKLGHTIVGGPSKLFKFFVNLMSPKSVVTYADRSIFNGNMYAHLGFKFQHYSSPNYKYFHNNKVHEHHSRVHFQKHKLSELLECFDPSLTEWENMKNNGYNRIWDCGNSVWSWES